MRPISINRDERDRVKNWIMFWVDGSNVVTLRRDGLRKKNTKITKNVLKLCKAKRKTFCQVRYVVDVCQFYRKKTFDIGLSEGEL